MKDKKYLDYYYIIIDDDQKKYNCFVPDMPSRYWNDKVVEAGKQGRNIHCIQKEKKEITDPSQYILDYEFCEIFLVDVPEDKSLEYTGRLPNYAKKADKKKIIIVNCNNCGGKFGELEVDYPGQEIMIAGKYKAKCLKCGRTVSDNYNWYR